MLIVELDAQLVEDWKASKKLCKSSTPNNKLGASALATVSYTHLTLPTKA